MRFLILLLFTLTTSFFLPTAVASSPKLVLAGVYEEGVPLEGYWVSEKLDGVRAYWDGKQFWSRGGNVYRSPEWFTAGFPDIPMDGELWMGRGRFAELSGTVRRHEPVDEDWRRVRFMVFDLPESEQPFSFRVAAMKALLEPSPSPYLSMVVQRRAADHATLMTDLSEVVAKGGEGLMLRRGTGSPQPGRSDDLLKVKRFDDDEAVVLRHLPGRGKYEGMLGALVVEWKEGRRFRIGTGFSDRERASPPPVGTTITFKHSGYTATGLPRFASFLRLREDEPETP